MTSTPLLSAILLVAFSGYITAQCPDLTIFRRPPTDQVADENDQIMFSCGFLFSSGAAPTWEFTRFNSTIRETLTDGVNGFSVTANLTDDRRIAWVNLTVPDVSSASAGEYFCTLTSDGCDAPLRQSATLRVTGMPVISLLNDSYIVDTLEPFLITGKVAGFPTPEITIFREVNGDFQPINSEVNPRFNYSFDAPSSTLNISLQRVMRADGGLYMIQASNIHGEDDAMFTILPNGPDPPVVTLASNAFVPPANIKVAATFGSEVRITCSAQESSFGALNTSIEWTDSQGTVVRMTTTGSVSVGQLQANGRELIIRSLSENLLGNYSCTASNERGTSTKVVQVFGPPPAPNDIPVVEQSGSGFIISWNRPSSSDIAITQYQVKLYMSRGLTVVRSNRVTVTVDHSGASYTFEDLDSGMYDVTVSSGVGMVFGAETGRANFTVEEPEFPLLPVVIGASVGGVVVILLVLILIVVTVYCSCVKRKTTPNSHQQRWGSEEDKMNQSTPPVQNTYTALALHDSSELPPSPLSPMTSSIGIDPKWEFPRENIQLSDVLAEGQFTVLYKGIARNLREKHCEVAVKAVKEGATEDDVKALIYEMDLLSSIEEHPNIVSLVRVCSVGKPLYMMMEYMCHGDLQGFLRACRGHHGMYTVSPGSGYQPPPKHLFTSRDILNMATKIANGMRYLADRKIVHRALCTRNVLVGSGMDVKIYNVGSFDASLDGVAKWMAPETLFDGTNTTYSDVWSFGVTLWELVTVGGTPYGEILPEDLYAQLQSGMRMPCPTHCAQEVYQIMSACWQKNPADRPHFSVIHDSLDELVMSKLNYVDVRSSDIDAYSQFDGSMANLSTAL